MPNPACNENSKVIVNGREVTVGSTLDQRYQRLGAGIAGEAINLQASGSLRVPESTPVNAAASSLTTALTGANNDLVWTAKAVGEAGDDISVEYVDPGTPSAELALALATKKISVNLATDAGTKSSADIGAGENGVVTTEVDLAGVAGDDYNIVLATGQHDHTTLTAVLSGTDLTVTLAMDGGTKSSAAIGSGDNGTVTTEVDDPGPLGDNYTIEVVAGTEVDGDMAAVLETNAITVTLGMDSGQCATAQIGGGVNGRVDCVIDAPGTAGNSWTITVSDAGASDCEMAAALVGTDITLTLGKTGASLAPSKNTAALVAAAITALSGVTATASGDGSASLTAAESSQNFVGGIAIAVDATKNTATFIAAAISLLAGVTATASGDGSSSISAAEGPTAFSGGVTEAPDDAKNTATLIAAAISLVAGFTATASGDGSTALGVDDCETVAFTGGADPAITTTGDDITAAVLLDEDISALVTAVDAAANDGSGVVTAMEETNLDGGADGTVGLANEVRQDDDYVYLCGTDGNTVTGKNWRRISKGTAY